MTKSKRTEYSIEYTTNDIISGRALGTTEDISEALKLLDQWRELVPHARCVIVKKTIIVEELE